MEGGSLCRAKDTLEHITTVWPEGERGPESPKWADCPEGREGPEGPMPKKAKEGPVGAGVTE